MEASLGEEKEEGKERLGRDNAGDGRCQLMWACPSAGLWGRTSGSGVRPGLSGRL